MTDLTLAQIKELELYLLGCSAYDKYGEDFKSLISMARECLQLRDKIAEANQRALCNDCARFPCGYDGKKQTVCRYYPEEEA